MRQKGFMLIETLVASTIILGSLIFLFIQFSSIKRSYDTSFKYDTVPDLYKTKELSNFIVNNDTYVIENTYYSQTKGYIPFDESHCSSYYPLSEPTENLCKELLTNMNKKYVIYTSNNIKKLKEYLNSNTNSNNDIIFSEDFKKYILSLDDVAKEGNWRIIVEYNDNTFASVTLNI